MQQFLPDLDFTSIIHKFVSHIPNVFGAAFMVLAIYVFYVVFYFVLKKILKRYMFERALIDLINTMLKVALFAVGVVFVARILGFNVSSAIAGIGVAGIAIGFAAQDALSNIVAGFFIFWDKPFRVGDYITYENKYGRVEQITVRTTRIRTQDNTYVVISNHKIINDVLVDHSTDGNTRVVIPVGISYKESIDDAREAILKKVAQIEGVLVTPPPDVVVDELADSSVKLLARVWIANASIERRVHFATAETVKKALDSAGIEIAFPHSQLIIEDIKDKVIEKMAQLKSVKK